MEGGTSYTCKIIAYNFYFISSCFWMIRSAVIQSEFECIYTWHFWCQNIEKRREGSLHPTLNQVVHPVWSQLVTGLRRRFILMQFESFQKIFDIETNEGGSSTIINCAEHEYINMCPPPRQLLSLLRHWVRKRL